MPANPVRDLLFLIIIWLRINLRSLHMHRWKDYACKLSERLSNFSFTWLLSGSLGIYACYFKFFRSQRRSQLFIRNWLVTHASVSSFSRFGSRTDGRSGANVSGIRWMHWRPPRTSRTASERSSFNRSRTRTPFTPLIRIIIIGQPKCRLL